MRKARLLTLECLEDRVAPATFGAAWRDPTHLTLSFALDGTPIAGHASELFGALAAPFPDAAGWQHEIVRAFQTWAVHANLSIGLREDGGDPFGVAGPMQGDARFGDIRVSAHRMSPEVLAISVPPDPFLSGTLAGDVFLNSAVPFDLGTLFPVLLHEAGHALGLGNSDDPASAMYSHFSPHAALTPEDVLALQALYGVRAPDRNEPNDSFGTATLIQGPALLPALLGTTPWVAYGDRMTLLDADYFGVQSIPLYAGPVTFTLQTSGISFLAPRLAVYDQNFNLLGQAESASSFGDIVSVRLPATSLLGQRYYVRVTSAAGDLFGIGRYALAVTFDDRSIIDPTALPTLLRGPYDLLTGQTEISQVLLSPRGALLNHELHLNDTFLTAEALPAVPGYAPDTRYEKVASLSDRWDTDFYRIRAPQAPPGETTVLTVTLGEMPVNGTLPVVFVYTASADPVSVEVLLNGNGTYAVQAAGLQPGATYFLRVMAAETAAPATGNYFLVADFGATAASLEEFAGGALEEAHALDEYVLYVAQSQLFQFVLSVDGPGPAQGVRVRAELYDAAGQLVFALAGAAGETVSGSSVLLLPGEYRVRFRAEGPDGVALPPLRYRFRGLSLTDPIGPAVEDPTFEPMYRCEEDPSLFCYPDDTMTSEPYLWVSTEPSTEAPGAEPGDHPDGFGEYGEGEPPYEFSEYQESKSPDEPEEYQESEQPSLTEEDAGASGTDPGEPEIAGTGG